MTTSNHSHTYLRKFQTQWAYMNNIVFVLSHSHFKCDSMNSLEWLKCLIHMFRQYTSVFCFLSSRFVYVGLTTHNRTSLHLSSECIVCTLCSVRETIWIQRRKWTCQRFSLFNTSAHTSFTHTYMWTNVPLL